MDSSYPDGFEELSDFFMPIYIADTDKVTKKEYPDSVGTTKFYYFCVNISKEMNFFLYVGKKQPDLVVGGQIIFFNKTIGGVEFEVFKKEKELLNRYIKDSALYNLKAFRSKIKDIHNEIEETNRKKTEQIKNLDYNSIENLNLLEMENIVLRNPLYKSLQGYYKDYIWFNPNSQLQGGGGAKKQYKDSGKRVFLNESKQAKIVYIKARGGSVEFVKVNGVFQSLKKHKYKYKK